VGTKQAPPAHQTNRKKKTKDKKQTSAESKKPEAKKQAQQHARQAPAARKPQQQHTTPTNAKPPALSLKTRSGNHANILPKLPCIFISYSYRCIIKPYHTIQDARNCLHFFLDPF
jgi:hypothetical protein